MRTDTGNSEVPFQWPPQRCAVWGISLRREEEACQIGVFWSAMTVLPLPAPPHDPFDRSDSWQRWSYLQVPSWLLWRKESIVQAIHKLLYFPNVLGLTIPWLINTLNCASKSAWSTLVYLSNSAVTHRMHVTHIKLVQPSLTYLCGPAHPHLTYLCGPPSRGVWCVVRRVWCVVRRVWCVMRRVWCIMRRVWCEVRRGVCVVRVWCVVRRVDV